LGALSTSSSTSQKTTTTNTITSARGSNPFPSFVVLTSTESHPIPGYSNKIALLKHLCMLSLLNSLLSVIFIERERGEREREREQFYF
jgi:hypothetical protein